MRLLGCLLLKVKAMIYHNVHRKNFPIAIPRSLLFINRVYLGAFRLHFTQCDYKRKLTVQNGLHLYLSRSFMT